jgi:hypothetical protein
MRKSGEEESLYAPNVAINPNAMYTTEIFERLR